MYQLILALFGTFLRLQELKCDSCNKLPFTVNKQSGCAVFQTVRLLSGRNLLRPFQG